MSAIRIVLADDHALVRQGFRRILEDEPDLSVVGEAGTGLQAIETVKTLEDRLKHISTPMSLSIIGCVVNGPGEARETDLGFTGGGAGKGHGQIYLNGTPSYRLDNVNLVDHIVELCEKKAAEIEAERNGTPEPLEAAQ